MAFEEEKAEKERRVRERLVFNGVQSLSDVELLSILLSKGKEVRGSLDLAESVMSEFGGNMVELGRASISRLRNIGGLGVERAAVLSVAFELGRRYCGSESVLKDTIVSDGDVVDMFKPMIADLPYEEFWAVYLSVAGKVLDRVKISQGGISATVVDHRLVVKRAIERLAAAIILVHNHPSGQAEPSAEDKILTEKLVVAASLFDITVADHVIITSGDCFSFCASGLLPDRE